MDNLQTIIPMALLGVVFLYTLVSGLIGLGRGLKKSVFSSIVIVLSAVISLIVTLIFIRPDAEKAGKISELMMQLVEKLDISMLKDISGISTVVAFCICMILVPFLFVVLFCLVRMILGIVSKFVIKKVRIMDNIPKAANRWGGLGVALVNGFILAVITLMPILGTVDLAAGVIKNLPETEQAEKAPAENGAIEMTVAGEEDDTMVFIEDCLSAATEKGGGKVVLVSGGRALYNLLASGKYYGEVTKLSNEAHTITDMVVSIMDVDGEIYDIILDVVDAVEDGTEKSTIVRNVAADLMSDFSDKWLAGEPFMGIEKISAGEFLDPLIDASLEVFSTTNRDYIHDDLEDVSRFLHELSNKHVTENVEDVDALVDTLSQENAIFDILSTIDRKDRMVPIVDAFNALGISIFSDRLGFLDTHDANYDTLMSDLRITLNAFIISERDEWSTVDEIRYIFDHHGVDIGNVGDECLPGALIGDFRDFNVVVNEDVEEFFMLYAAAYNNERGIREEGNTLYINDVPLNAYRVDNYRDSRAYYYGINKYDFAQAKTLGAPDSMQAILVTTQDLLDRLTSYEDISDRHEESDRIETVLVSMIDCYYAFDGSEVHPADIMKEMGHIFDYMNVSKVYHDATPIFLTAIMQSDKVSGTLGLTIEEMTNISNEVTGGRSENVGYTEICKTIAQSFDVLESVNDDAVTGEATKDKIAELMQDLTPESAEVMSNIVTPSLMESYGVVGESAEKSAEAVGVLFDKMSHFTENHPDADEAGVSHEADAVNKIITMSIKANNDTDSSKSMFNNDGEGSVGKLEMNAYDVVDLLVTSTVATDTINQMVYGDGESDAVIDPMDVSKGMSAEDNAALSEALASYSNDNPEKAAELEGIAALFGITIGG